MSSCGVKRTSISSLKPGFTDNLIVGVIIARQDPRKLKKSDNEGHRGVWQITLRDSPEDFINVTFWGALPYINEVSESFHIGHVVDICNAKVSVRVSANAFQPHVSSPFQLSMSDNGSNIVHHVGEDSSYFLQLLQVPTKPATDIFTIADVQSRGANSKFETIDLLVAVRYVEPVRKITTKDGRSLISRTVLVMDYTSKELPFQIWNSDVVNQAENWEPRLTILFIADVSVKWNDYRQCIEIVDKICTVLTENPISPEAESLREYAQTVPIRANAIIDKLADDIPDPSTIRQVMTIRQVLDRAKIKTQDISGSNESQFTALVYCLVTHFDIDGSSRITFTRCVYCQQAIQEQTCTTPNCIGMTRPSLETAFDIRVSLTDHTGSLEYCRLVSSPAERVLNCTAEHFQTMALDDKTRLKWSLLLERCCARILVLCASSTRRRPYVSLLACSTADPQEVTSHIPLH